MFGGERTRVSSPLEMWILSFFFEIGGVRVVTEENLADGETRRQYDITLKHVRVTC